MEVWVPLESYPGYSVSNLGRVRNDRRDKVLAVARTQTGLPFTSLMLDGVQVKRAVSKLVAEAFVPNPRPKFFTTPIHLDGNLRNCYAENLLWRPRWFAIKFARQFRLDLSHSPRPILETETREVFESPWLPVTIWGLLYNDIVIATANFTWVFPTMQTFEWVI